jgi:predicted amidohydrolase
MCRLRVALINFSPVYGEIDRNLDLIERHIRNLSSSHVDLVCFPEMCLTGYLNSGDIAHVAQSAHGNGVQRLMDIARTTGIAVLAGLPELEPSYEKLYISHCFCTPEGQVYIYRKIHLSKREKEVFSPGKELGVFSWRSCRLGIQLCFDAHFPEFGLAQALAGAQVIFVCSASPMGPAAELRQRWLRYLPARAYDSGCYILTCNQHGLAPFGASFPGMAMAFAPDGSLIDESQQDQALVVDLDLNAAEESRSKRPFIYSRRPDIYRLPNK